MNGRKVDRASTWAPVDLEPIIAGVQAGTIVGPVPQLLARTDGVCLLYPGETHSLAGEPESCKGWIALGAVTQTITAAAGVLYLDFEDSPASIVTRLLALGATPQAIGQHFVYVRPTEEFSAPALCALLDARPYALAVIDGVSEAYSLLGLDIASTPDAVSFFGALPRPIAERGPRTCCSTMSSRLATTAGGTRLAPDTSWPALRRPTAPKSSALRAEPSRAR